MTKVYSGISCNLDGKLLAAALPLFIEGSVEALEWSFDALFRHSKIPGWFIDLLSEYSKSERLLGHGVYFSIFSGTFSEEQKIWLEKLRKTARQFPFAHVTEHFGFMTGEDFHKGAPLNVPLTNETLEIARDRIARMHLACGCPVGLENLAFSYDKNSIRKQGQFLKEIVTEINGFLILDLHNIYCQVKNFNVDFLELIKTFPLELVREVHISGGSWEASKIEEDRIIRRDTHDAGVPSEVFTYLKTIIPMLPNLKFVIFEQLGTALDSESSKEQFRLDFRKMKEIVGTIPNLGNRLTNDFLPIRKPELKSIAVSEKLSAEQKILSGILENSDNFENAKHKLTHSILANSEWKIEEWDDIMLETAFEISQKWKGGFKT